MASQYFARLSQRLINAITAPTQEGRLYEVDMRLRPSGNAGPIASSLEAFAKYQASAAWTWEHMALTRARIISAPDEMSRRIRAIIDATLTRRRDGDALLADVADMRQRMDREHHSDLIWEVKHHRGGLVDIEFIAQYLLLAHAHDHPDLPVTGTRDMLRGLRARGMLEPAHLEILLDAHALSQAVQGTLRLTIEGYFRADDETEVPEALSRLLVAATGTEDFVALQARLASTADAVQAIFRELIETPAQALAERAGGTRDATGDAKGGEIERNQE
jgi:glutamate-ammonia-ligase adenylyltransferase